MRFVSEVIGVGFRTSRIPPSLTNWVNSVVVFLSLLKCCGDLLPLSVYFLFLINFHLTLCGSHSHIEFKVKRKWKGFVGMEKKLDKYVTN